MTNGNTSVFFQVFWEFIYNKGKKYVEKFYPLLPESIMNVSNMTLCTCGNWKWLKARAQCKYGLVVSQFNRLPKIERKRPKHQNMYRRKLSWPGQENYTINSYTLNITLLARYKWEIMVPDDSILIVALSNVCSFCCHDWYQFCLPAHQVGYLLHSPAPITFKMSWDCQITQAHFRHCVS